MNSGTRPAPMSSVNGYKTVTIALQGTCNGESRNTNGACRDGSGPSSRCRVFVASENRLMREALARLLTKKGDMEVVALPNPSAGPPEAEMSDPDVMVLTSRGPFTEDIATIRKLRIALPASRLLLMGMSGEESEFLQLVRAGIRGYLLLDASADDVVRAVRAVLAGEAVCPGALCAVLFRFFEREAAAVPSATLHHQLGLTRREQQLLPLIAQGLTNKEIANEFCLSEQTVKNHLYRMKHKIGAEDRLGIIHMCRTHGMAL